MNTMVLAAQAAQQGGGFGGMLIMLVALFAIMWFFMIRPQQKLQEGSKVVTGGGVYGTVKRLDNEKNVVEVEVARGVVITVDKNYVFQDAAQQQPNA